MQGEVFLVKSHFAQFLVNSQCFIPCAKFLKGVRMQHLGRKCLRAGFSPALHWDVTCDRQECILGLAGEGDRDLVLLSCFLLPAAVCPCHLLVAEALAACSRFLRHQFVPLSSRHVRAHLLKQRRERPILLEHGSLL